MSGYSPIESLRIPALDNLLTVNLISRLLEEPFHLIKSTLDKELKKKETDIVEVFNNEKYIIKQWEKMKSHYMLNEYLQMHLKNNVFFLHVKDIEK